MRIFIIASGIVIGGLGGHGAYLIVSTAPPQVLLGFVALGIVGVGYLLLNL